MLRAAIFDLDGTLIDSLADIGAAMNHALASLSLPSHRLDDYKRFVGEGVEQLVLRALPPDRGDLKQALTERYLVRYEEVLLEQTVAYPGIPELLDGLVTRGVALGVLSNKPDRATKRIVEALFGAWPFTAVAGRRDGVPRKPDPAAALEIARLLDYAPADTAFVGDTAIDMQTAVAAGMLPIGAAWGFRPEELHAAGARIVVQRPGDLLDAL